MADFITSGTLIANIIKAGVLQSQDGSSWWDLDTGEVHLATYVDKEEFRQSIADFDKKLEDAKGIGARNLLPSTRLMEPFKRYSSSSYSVTLDVDEEGFAVATFPARGTSSLDNAIQSRQPIKYSVVQGQKVTISAMIRSEDAEAINSDVTHGVMLELDLCGEEEYDADGNLLEPARTKYVRIPLFEQQLSTEWANAHPEEVRRKAYYSFVCPQCGKPFMSYGNSNRKYCSHTCANHSRKNRGVANG